MGNWRVGRHIGFDAAFDAAAHCVSCVLPVGGWHYLIFDCAGLAGRIIQPSIQHVDWRTIDLHDVDHRHHIANIRPPDARTGRFALRKFRRNQRPILRHQPCIHTLPTKFVGTRGTGGGVART
jgi:hypothetical protein